MGLEPDDIGAWATRLYDTCAAELLLYGRALGLGHAEAEDVLHDTFQALLHLTDAPREPRFYLVRAFRNRALNHRRSLWRRLARELESKRWFESSPEVSPDEDAAQRALTRLPREQREVIVLKLWHHLTFERIGELLGISPNTAAGRYRYGLNKLRQQVKHPIPSPHESPPEPGNDAAWMDTAPAFPKP